jgi:hypothetical protein
VMVDGCEATGPRPGLFRANPPDPLNDLSLRRDFLAFRSTSAQIGIEQKGVRLGVSALTGARLSGESW